MRALHFIKDLFRKYKGRSVFSEALTEGIKDVFLEMGYKFHNNEKS